jgi:hypothetical protein
LGASLNELLLADEIVDVLVAAGVGYIFSPSDGEDMYESPCMPTLFCHLFSFSFPFSSRRLSPAPEHGLHASTPVDVSLSEFAGISKNGEG